MKKVILIIILIIGCDSVNEYYVHPLVGKWELDQLINCENNEPLNSDLLKTTLTLNEDQTYALNQCDSDTNCVITSGQWSATSNKLYISDSGGGLESFDYSISEEQNNNSKWFIIYGNILALNETSQSYCWILTKQ